MASTSSRGVISGPEGSTASLPTSTPVVLAHSVASFAQPIPLARMTQLQMLFCPHCTALEFPGCDPRRQLLSVVKYKRPGAASAVVTCSLRTQLRRPMSYDLFFLF